MKSLNEVADDVRRTMARKASFAAAAAETFHHAHVVKLVPSSAEIDEQQPGFYFKLILIFFRLAILSRCILIPCFGFMI